MKTLIIGLGNPILSDDGVGVMVAGVVQDVLVSKATPDIEVTEASVGGLRLMEMMVGFDRVILIDALTQNTAPPGTVCRLTLEELRSISPTQHSASAHDTSLVTALELGRRMSLDLPQEIVIYGIVVDNIADFSDQPTPPVAAAIPTVAAAVLAELDQ